MYLISKFGVLRKAIATTGQATPSGAASAPAPFETSELPADSTKDSTIHSLSNVALGRPASLDIAHTNSILTSSERTPASTENSHNLFQKPAVSGQELLPRVTDAELVATGLQHEQQTTNATDDHSTQQAGTFAVAPAPAQEHQSTTPASNSTALQADELNLTSQPLKLTAATLGTHTTLSASAPNEHNKRLTLIQQWLQDAQTLDDVHVSQPAPQGLPGGATVDNTSTPSVDKTPVPLGFTVASPSTCTTTVAAAHAPIKQVPVLCSTALPHINAQPHVSNVHVDARAHPMHGVQHGQGTEAAVIDPGRSHRHTERSHEGQASTPHSHSRAPDAAKMQHGGTIPARVAADAATGQPLQQAGSRCDHRCDEPAVPPRLPLALGPQERTKTIAVASHCPEDLHSAHWSVEDFVLQKKLYEGSLSVVCQAQHKKSGRYVALKIYKRSRLHEMERFQLAREICLHIRILHPYIISLYAAWKDSKYVYLALEWAPRGNLYDYLLSRGGKLPESDAVTLAVKPLLSALAFLHSQQFIHRDVKLENVILDASCNVKLIDFGLAIDQKFEQANTRLGTFGYFAPEVLDCPLKKGPFDFKDQTTANYGCKVDIWSLGVLVFELLSGKAPFAASSPTKIIEAIRTRVLEYPADLSPAAKDFLSQALQRDVEVRATARQLLQHPWVLHHTAQAAS